MRTSQKPSKIDVESFKERLVTLRTAFTQIWNLISINLICENYSFIQNI